MSNDEHASGAAATVTAAPESQQPPPQIFQTPEWETPINPPKRNLFARKPLATQTFIPPAFSSRSNSDDAIGKETLTKFPTHVSSFATGSVMGTPRPSLRARFDALFPPHKTYPFGLARRRFLLFVVLPALFLLLFVFPLALGLGLRNRHAGAQNLPLPTDTGGVFSGDLTFYNPALGACGWESTDNDPICAVSHLVWDQLQVGSNPNTNVLCGKKIRVQRNVEGVGSRTIDVTVVDRCVGCQATDIDLSPAMFNQLANPDQGRVVGKWAWL
jgi:Lytic transglycolase